MSFDKTAREEYFGLASGLIASRSLACPGKCSNLSNSDETAAGLLAIMVSTAEIEDPRARSIRTLKAAPSYTAGGNHECGSTQGEMDAVQRGTETAVWQVYG